MYQCITQMLRPGTRYGFQDKLSRREEQLATLFSAARMKCELTLIY